MNYLYNLADVVIAPSSALGFGLSIALSLMAGTMVIANTTGGLQDQMMFVSLDGTIYNNNVEIPSNNAGHYKRCGKWAIPLYPNMSIVGHPKTPYIYDTACNILDITMAIKYVYDLPAKDRLLFGLLGRLWLMSDKSMMNASAMSNRIIRGIDFAIDNFLSRRRYLMINVVLLINKSQLSNKGIYNKLTNNWE